jgi:hypothetical protein
VAPGEEAGLLEAAVFMDTTECETLLPAARSGAGPDQVLFHAHL